nr:hypothetical protein [Tanacetum cinerariifolium]
MRIEQYFLMTDYSLWEVILNGDSHAPTRVIDGVLQPVALTTAEQRLARKNELKARDLEEQSLDDLFNSLKIYEAEVKISSSASTSTQNINFVSSTNTDSTNEPVSADASVSVVSAKIPVSALPNIDADDLEKMDFKWQMAMLTVECYNCHRKGHFARECRSSKDTRRNGVAKPQRRNVPVETSASNSDASLPPSPIYDRYQSRYGYHAIPLPYTGTFLPPKPDLVFNNAPNDVETVHTAFNVELSHTKPDNDLSHTHRPSAPILEDWVSDLEDESETKILSNVPSFVPPTEQVKSHRPSVQHVTTSILTANPKTAIPKPTSNGTRRNRKACFVYVVHIAIVPKSKLVPINAVRPVTTAVPKINVTRPRQDKPIVTKPNSPPRRHINHSPSTKACNFPSKVTAAKAPMGNPQHALKDKRVIDSGCSRHMIGNMFYLSNFEELKICCLWCVLFTDTECLVLSSEFKLPDENQVLLRVHRENNMYNVDLKNIAPFGDLTCLFAKATLDESNLWHRRLGHINFKTMNKLVKGNLVRGLPSKVFENDHTCVACKKGKQHRASCKTKPAEAVNTACYVKNRVLVTKPQNKTPYELLHGRTPSIGFMRPFGCPVTILNTLDFLGKFDGNVDEGFLVGCSVSSKAFRVFNSRTRIVQETLHINFLENKPNIIGSGPTWLFDIDTLTKTMNYQPVTAGNQSNPIAGVQKQFDAEKAGDEAVPQYVFFPVWSFGSTNPQNTDGDVTFDAKEPEFEGRKPESEVNVSPSKFEDLSDNSINEDNVAGTLVLAVGQLSPNNTNTFSAAGPSNADASPTHGKSSCIDTSQLPDDPNMPELEDITYSDDEDDVYHAMTQIIGDLSLATQTRSMTRVAKYQGGLSQINNDDFHTCIFSCFLSQEEPKRVHQALKDPSWIKAMQEELLQFKMQKVWVLVDFPHEKRAIGTKWVLRNKNDERGIVVRNKARLFAQGHTQENDIDYEEVFAPVARIEAIRLFLAYASFKGFMVYQMDVKSALLYKTIEKEVYVCQPPGFEDPDYPDKVYKVVKALYRLHQAPRA